MDSAEEQEKLLEQNQNGEEEEEEDEEPDSSEARKIAADLEHNEGSSEMEDDELMTGTVDPLTLLETHDQSGTFPKSNVVIRLSPTIHPDAVTWLIEKLTGKKQDGGAELLVRAEPFSGKSKESLTLHVTASKLKFLECAEYMELKKLDSRGVLREFNVGDLDDFLHGSIGLDNLLTAAEKQLIVTHELDNVRVLAPERTLPGYPNTILHRGQSIFNIYQQEGLVVDVFPLHDEPEVESLGKQWYYALFKAQPFDEIRQYFGDAIALYFSFLGFYTVSLVAPAILGIVQFFLSETTTGNSAIFFCIFNLIWVTITQELWKRKCSELAYAWGTLRMTQWGEDPRANYRGVMTIDPVTGRYQPYSPWWKTAIKVYCVSLPIVILSICAGAYVMLYSIWLEEYLTEAKTRHGSHVAGYMTMLPSIGYSALVSYVNNGYHKVATFLTEWENHRTQSQFERHRVSKLVIFEFVHTFMSMFYLAFYIQDMEMLKNQVTVMLLVNQFINHFKEALLPLVIRRGFSIAKQHMAEKFPNLMYTLRLVDRPDAAKAELSESEKAAANTVASLGLQFLEPEDPRIQETAQQVGMDEYEGTFDDYLEMFIQFGYVYLFSAVSPLAAFYAIVNNVIEIRADAFKLCKVTQRPLAKRVKDIGAWQAAFELIGVMAVTTNCALLCLSPNLRSYGSSMTAAEWLLLFVIIEHVLIGVKLGIAILIPDIPSWVKMALACVEYRSRQALKNEQTFKSRRNLTRRFKTIHGVATKKDVAAGSTVQRRKPKKQSNQINPTA